MCLLFPIIPADPAAEMRIDLPKQPLPDQGRERLSMLWEAIPAFHWHHNNKLYPTPSYAYELPMKIAGHEADEKDE